MSYRQRLLIAIFFAGLIVLYSSSPQFLNIYQLPPHIRIIQGETKVLNVNFPLSVNVTQNESILVKGSSILYGLSQPVLLKPMNLGSAIIDFKLFGVIPFKKVEVDVLPTLKLVPGGHSIGVVLRSQGVIVVGFSPVETETGLLLPAKQSGINIGDIILSINGIPIQSDSQVAEIIDNCGQQNKTVNILLKRGNEKLNISLHAVLCNDTRRYRIGLFVRDSAAGVGTLTFYDPESNVYGALGHIITDSDTNQPIDCQQGKIVFSSVSGINYGKRGHPGEKIGIFIEEDKILGNIQKNTPFGIYGKLEVLLSNNLYAHPIEVASMSQIEIGPAKMLTVIDGQTIESFEINIEKINMQDVPEGKGLVIKVTDRNLLEKTGGIIQGMSGSPIIQNGKLVGAVTHVFVHDPTKGYGCFADWMLMESGLIPKKVKNSARKLFSFAGSFFL